MVCLMLSLWLFITRRAKQQSQRRLQAARRNTLEKYRRLLHAIAQYEAEDLVMQTRRRMRMASLWQKYICRSLISTVSRTSRWWDLIVPGFTNAQWSENFRMSEETFNFLCNKLRLAMERQDMTLRQSVPLKKRVVIALWKLATGLEDQSIGHLFGVSVATVCRCVEDFCAAAEALLVPEQIRFPDEGRFREMAAYIENRWGLPHCVGAIDGSHISIIAPQHDDTEYLNREGWHSIILQGVVDGKGLFWNVFAGLPGSLHDAQVLRLSTLWELASRGNLFPAHIRSVGAVSAGYYILGDSAYPLQNWLLKPLHDTGRLTEEQHMFNQKISQVRVVVENAFSRLKGRWHCLLKTNNGDIQLVKSMVLTCCALHNLCENHGETFESSWDDPAAAALEPVVAAAQDVEEGGRDVRDALMRYLCSNEPTI
ncbi:uncharacterized protein KZ484_016191 [Pholidichthys leucotaenia]